MSGVVVARNCKAKVMGEYQGRLGQRKARRNGCEGIPWVPGVRRCMILSSGIVRGISCEGLLGLQGQWSQGFARVIGTRRYQVQFIQRIARGHDCKGMLRVSGTRRSGNCQQVLSDTMVMRDCQWQVSQ